LPCFLLLKEFITNIGEPALLYSISPAISNGLSFNAATGTISGTPIASSDPVTSDCLDQPATKVCIQVWCGLYSDLRNSHQCCHPLHSQQQER
jgi:hypothetical protein